MFAFLLTSLLVHNGFALKDKLQAIKVDPATHGFVDSLGRTRIFHGMNAVYKIAPWHPDTVGFDPLNSLSDIDAKNLNEWGFNIVRLGVMWPGVEPVKRQYNSTYLDQIETIVKNLADQNIYVILDFHQDLWHRKFCGEGVPDYVYETCVKAEPEYKHFNGSFPHPAVNKTLPIDGDGNPTLESCLEVGFGTYYLSAEVGSGFQCLYDNVDGLWDSFGLYWQTVAQRFSSISSVLGYELINEPWMGDIYEKPARLVPGYVEKNYLQPMYQHLHKMIRAVDDEKIVFFEGLTIDYWPNGFEESPGGSSYDDRQALAYHIYCPLRDTSVGMEVACDLINTELFNNRRRDVERIGGGWLMTEFGASRDIKGDMYALNFLADKMDENQQSWMYWQFKYYNDITTCTPEGEALYFNNGTVSENKINVLSRTYPEMVAGALVDYKYHHNTKGFTMHYQPWAKESTVSDDESRTSSIYFNKDFYPKGVDVVVTIDGKEVDRSTLDYSCGLARRNVKLIHTAGPVSNATVEVTLRPCLTDSKVLCTCHHSE